MSLKRPLAFAALLMLVQLPVQATESIWATRSNALVSSPADYQSLTCPRKPPAPYTGPLQLQSKYDQSDSSKSTLVEQSKETARIAELIKGYIGALVTASNQFERAKDAEQARLDLACIDQWLDAWAKGDALRNPDASGTGIASRKWALAAIASTLLKVQALGGGAFELNAAQRGWLQGLGEQVIAEHTPRQRPDFAYFNNHDYWAGWAVAATGMLLGRDDFLAWADINLRRGLSQATPSASADARYLPLEVARAQLGADYSNYAMVPLTLLVETAEHNGRALSAQERQTFEQLANFTARAVLEPKALPELDGRKQKKVSSHKMSWLIPFLNRYPDHTWARALYDDQDGEVDNYSQIGGRLKPLYSGFK
jgi:poly(beta-D-mannuronate) lyase